MIIETQNLTKNFWRHDAVQDLNLAVPEGATCALIGANGAGKTTTMRMLVNVMAPDRGSARVLGVDSRQLKPADRLRIAFLSENQELPDRLTVAQYFEYLTALYPGWDGALEQKLRAQFELPPSRALGKLSHGMRMKAMLIGALSFRPKLLILDEPLSGLDPLVRDEVMSGILSQADETTILISSHELSEIEGCTTHVAFMARGRLMFQESIEALGARFREVIVTLSQGPDRRNLPETWLNPQIDGAILRFVDSAYVDDAQQRAQLQKTCGAVLHLESAALSLRDISKALMRSTRQEV
ncbi:MAG TPA: ABC transporter ATP-binding protein [Steroidobacteraceae bacterium]|nr:ABC transporter ATP-binding protein [Steroidobacteraceae bacterium]